MIGPNGGMSNNLMLPTAGLQNFVPDPASLVSTNYFALPAPSGLPAVGPGTTNFPGIPGSNYPGASAGPASGSAPEFTSITRNYAPEDRGKKQWYAEELKKQMIEKDIRNENERKKLEEWEDYQDRRIARDLHVSYQSAA